MVKKPQILGSINLLSALLTSAGAGAALEQGAAHAGLLAGGSLMFAVAAIFLLTRREK